MLEYNEITERKYVVIDGQPYEVLTSHVARTQQRKPTNQVKAKNLITGKLADFTFRSSDKVREADIIKRNIKYLYTNRGEIWFCEETDPSKRFKLEESVLGPAMRFMKPNSLVEALVFDEVIIGVKLPVKVDLKVTEAPPAIKGNTAQGGNKVITLETGATVNAPLFVKEGDTVRINTDTGEYSDRL
jgi:elongation factor P